MSCGHPSNQKGNTPLFFTFVMFPMMLVAGAISVDVAAWSRDKNYAQREADRVAQLAALALPDSIRAERVARLNANLPLNSTIEVSANSYSVDVSITGYTRLGFLSHTASWQIYSQAKQVPSNLAVVFVDGQSLRPQAVQSALDVAKWGNRVMFPRANFFKDASPPAETPYLAEWNWTERYEEYGLWATLGCYNLPFSALKEAVIRIVATSEMNVSNSTTVLVTPGSGDNILSYAVLSSNEKDFQASLFHDFVPEYQTSSATCAAIATSGFNNVYRLSRALQKHDEERWCEFPVAVGCDVRVVDGLCASLSTLQRVYFESAELGRNPELGETLNAAITSVVRANAMSVPERGNMNGKNRVVLISDYLPESFEELEVPLVYASQNNVGLDVILFEHVNSNLGNYHYLRSLLSESDLGTFSFFVASTEAELVESVAPLVLESNKTVVLTK